MTTSLRPRPRTSTGTLLTTFILGLLIGVSGGYLFWAPGGLFPQEPGVEQAPPPPPEAAVEVQPEATDAPGAPAYEENLWPGRHLFVAVSGAELPDAERAVLREVLPGAVILPPAALETPARTRQLVDGLRTTMGLGTTAASLPLIVAAPEHLPGVPMPGAAGVWPPEQEIVSYADALAAACRERGVGALLTPDLDQGWQRASSIFPATDPAQDQDRTIALALAVANALLERGILTIASTYPGIGHAVNQADVPIPVLDMPLNALAEALYPFSEAVAQEIPGVLVGHVAVPALDRAQPQRPASLSPVLVEAVLREKWGYQGVIVAQDVSSLPGTGAETAVVQALRAGCDAVIVKGGDPAVLRSAVAAVETAVSVGALSNERLADSKARLQTWQERIGAPHGLKGPLPVYAPPVAAQADSVAEAPADAAPEESAPTAFGPAGEAVPETPEDEIAVQPEAEPAEDAGPAPQPPGTRKETYVIQPGDRLMRIAERQGVSAADLVRWNALGSADNIKAGQRLVVYVPEEVRAPESPAEPLEAPVVQEPPSAENPPAEPEAPAEPAVEVVPEAVTEAGPEAAPPAVPAQAPLPEPEAVVVEEAPVDEPEAVVVEDTSVDKVEAAGQPDAPPPGVEQPALETVRHRVAPGETVRSIARRYNVSWRDIVEWNNLRDANDIKQGQRIVVKTGAGE